MKLISKIILPIIAFGLFINVALATTGPEALAHYNDAKDNHKVPAESAFSSTSGFASTTHYRRNNMPLPGAGMNAQERSDYYDLLAQADSELSTGDGWKTQASGNEGLAISTLSSAWINYTQMQYNTSYSKSSDCIIYADDCILDCTYADCSYDAVNSYLDQAMAIWHQ